MNLGTKSSPISLLFILLDDVWMVLAAMVLSAVFMEVPFYTDAASNFVYVECQISMGAGETVMGKTRFEQMCWNLAGVTIKNFHSARYRVYH
jgi:hypothetical protein